MVDTSIDFGILAGAAAPVQFLFLVSRTPHFALNVMRTLARRLRTANTGL
jgi:hypothetical protein